MYRSERGALSVASADTAMPRPLNFPEFPGWLGPLLNQIPTPHRAVSRFNWDLRDMPTAEFHAPFHLGRPWPTNDIFIFSQWGISRLFTLDCTGRRHEDSKTQLWRFQMLIAEDRAPHATVLALSFVGAPAMCSPRTYQIFLGPTTGTRVWTFGRGKKLLAGGFGSGPSLFFKLT